MLRRCSPGHAPWSVIPANRTWFRTPAASRIGADTPEDMTMTPTPDLGAIREGRPAATRAPATSTPPARPA